jgi:transcriptional regulator with XRE-family HTH domain
VEIDQLGRLLRDRRVAAGRTIASVAAEAGLSVPYIANLENGRGNPTLSAVNRLAAALGVRLVVRSGPEEPPAPAAAAEFSRSPRFGAEVTRLAQVTHTPEAVVRERLLAVVAALGELADRPLSDLDRHRTLDTVVLITRS